MALKPDGLTCWLREQLVEDLPSGLTLLVQAAEDGGTRVVIASRALGAGNREFVFDPEGRLVRVGASALKNLHL